MIRSMSLTSHSTAKFLSATSSFCGGGRPQVPLRELFQSRAGTWVEPPTFRKLAGKLRHMKESDPDRARTYRGDGQVIISQTP